MRDDWQALAGASLAGNAFVLDHRCNQLAPDGEILRLEIAPCIGVLSQAIDPLVVGGRPLLGDVGGAQFPEVPGMQLHAVLADIIIMTNAGDEGLATLTGAA